MITQTGMRIAHERAARRRGSQRRGFTLIEVAVVFFILLILAALLLPAVQSAREGSRRALCSNKLKQLAIALQNYNEMYGQLPAGIDYSGKASAPGLWSWRVSVLPYLDQASIYDSLDLRLGIRDPKNQSRLHVSLSEFACPSDDAAGKSHKVDSGVLQGEWTTASYMGVPGTWGLVTLGNGQLISPAQCGQLDQMYQVGTRSGVLYENSWIKIKNITDGTSNTLFVGERGVPSTLDSGWLSGPGLGDACPGGWTDVVLPMEDNIGRSGFGHAETDQQKRFRWWSHHIGGQHFVTGDASVRFISYNIDQKTLISLCNRADGGVVEIKGFD